MSIVDSMLTILKVMTLITVAVTATVCLGLGFAVKRVAADRELEF